MVLKATVFSCLACSNNGGLHLLGATATREGSTEVAFSFNFDGSEAGAELSGLRCCGDETGITSPPSTFHCMGSFGRRVSTGGEGGTG